MNYQFSADVKLVLLFFPMEDYINTLAMKWTESCILSIDTRLKYTEYSDPHESKNNADIAKVKFI